MKSRRIGRRPNNGNRHRTVLVATTDADETKNQNAKHSGPKAKIHPHPSKKSHELKSRKRSFILMVGQNIRHPAQCGADTPVRRF